MSNLRTEFIQGQEVWLDKELTNFSKVKVLNQTPNKLFTTVYITDTISKVSTQWEVMTNRLSPIKKPKCYNCKYSGQTFKLGNVSHQHCEHPKYTKEQFESGELSAWDTVNKFSDTCQDHSFRDAVS